MSLELLINAPAKIKEFFSNIASKPKTNTAKYRIARGIRGF